MVRQAQAERPDMAYGVPLSLSLSKGERPPKKKGCDVSIAAIATDGPSLSGPRSPGLSYWLSIDSAMRRSSSFSWSPSL
jgi:hypothetical protein